MAKRVNIALKEQVHIQAKVLAALKKKNLADYLASAIEEAVQRDKKLLEDVFK